MTKTSTVACAIVAMFALSTLPPAFSQSTPKQQQGHESTGESSSQHQLGGQKRDRRINREMLRNSQNRMGYRSHHAYRSQKPAQ